MTKTQLKELKEAFDLFDTEKNGFIDAKELKRNLEILGFSCKNSSLNTFFADVESAETRNITFQQFLEVINRGIVSYYLIIVRVEGNTFLI